MGLVLRKGDLPRCSSATGFVDFVPEGLCDAPFRSSSRMKLHQFTSSARCEVASEIGGLRVDLTDLGGPST